MIGQLQWLVTLGRFDIHAQVTTMSRFRSVARKEHLERLQRILLNPGFHPRAGNQDVTRIPQLNYSTSQQQLTSMQPEVAYLTKVPITTKPVVRTN